MEVAKPPELRRLTVDSIQEAIDQDPYTRFEVLKDWQHGNNDLRGGSVLRADHFPHLLAYVRAGLMLGVPADQAAVIRRLRAESEARAQAAMAETKLAQASTARAEARAAEARAAAAAIGTDVPPPMPPVTEETSDLAF